MYNITEKIEISAGAIRSRARQGCLDTLGDKSAYELWDAQHSELPRTVAGQFYLAATDRQRTRVVNLAMRKYNGTQKVGQPPKRRLAIIAAIKDGRHTPKGIAAHMGVSIEATRDGLSRAKRGGLVDNPRWELVREDENDNPDK